MIIQDVFRVLYSPLKAFEEIAKTPNIKGPFFIFLVTLLASIGAQYISSSKVILQAENGELVPLTTTAMFNQILMATLRDVTFSFFLNWLLYGATFLLILKLFRIKEGLWHKFFIMIGYIFIVSAVFVVVTAILISTFPAIDFDFETWTKAFLEGNAQAQDQVRQKYIENWLSLPAYQITSYLFVVEEVWIALLGAVAIHFLREVSWNKALIISAVASVISLFLRFPLII